MSAATPITVRQSPSPTRIRLPIAFAAPPQNRCASVWLTIATGAAARRRGPRTRGRPRVESAASGSSPEPTVFDRNARSSPRRGS